MLPPALFTSDTPNEIAAFEITSMEALAEEKENARNTHVEATEVGSVPEFEKWVRSKEPE
jgi:hypothetical protein